MLVTEMWLQGPPEFQRTRLSQQKLNLKKANGHHHACSGTGASQFFPNHPLRPVLLWHC